MSIKIASPGSEDEGNGTFHRVSGPDAVFDPEVISEDGIYCPFCGKMQGWDTARLQGFSKCSICGEWFHCERVVTIAYRSGGRRRFPRPSNN